MKMFAKKYKQFIGNENNRKIFIVNVLGTAYTVTFCGVAEEPNLEDNDGFCDTTIKAIFIKDDHEIDKSTVKDLRHYKKAVLRHELIHAFLYESGLFHQCGWATNEEIVDWIAIQLPKMIDTLNSCKQPLQTLGIESKEIH